MDINLNNRNYYNNRELSWLMFNYRVLEESMDTSNPLLERLKFLAITASNLDEFYMVRVGGLKDQEFVEYNVPENKTQLTAHEQLIEISKLNKKNCVDAYEQFHKLMDELSEYNIHFTRPDKLPESLKSELESTFDSEIFPTLTPLGIDAYRSFPKLMNKKINIYVNLSNDTSEEIAIVQLPSVLKRFYEFRERGNTYIVMTEDIIEKFVYKLFNGYTIDRTFSFRITRNADQTLHEEGALDMLVEIERFLKEREKGVAVRLEIDVSKYKKINGSFLRNSLFLTKEDVFKYDGPLDLTFLFELVSRYKNELKNLLFKPFYPQVPKFLGQQNIYDLALERDIFLHHPYESFQPVVDFIEQASLDPDVYAIKQTLYRVSNDSPIIQALKKSSANGKQVTVLVELKARFDEENNVQWAKELEDAGCHVIYGMNYLKTHSKITLVVKKVRDQLVSFVHLSTGNYNDSTAKLYTDMGIITTDKKISKDAINFFNYLSGYSNKPQYESLLVAPYEIQDKLVEFIDREIEHQKKQGNGYIFAKMNALTDKRLIKKLLQASIAGVKIDLMIRGICCLRPNIEGVSDNITVRSIVGRFLEHSRIYYFGNGGEEEIYLSSADMMTRNMLKRVEIMFPVVDKNIQEEVKELIDIFLKDNVKTRIGQSDGTYKYIETTGKKFNSQEELLKRALKNTALLHLDNANISID
ncbi:RNA degradosome polyphosphate kinase [Phocicoccus pinnipedialis]|uniref:Polyphosphate kinase n=1 Tax=Phocicoccus pinnipedialis TaxID=110845 RepID=A0A6V7RL39_9BACL|nr:RNA degradosome polyphosphate kinase [Jeotgalicoccus pinnipedialis]MBP1939611.1 polyphosphate kinase [Jeotgalicoccus pinnipedialis]CAD2079000.1 Polyphosphate kinase [Jeotgalicoccus pinnipedialis]